MAEELIHSHESAGDKKPSLFPLVQTIRNYRPEWFRSDLLAGISVCVVLIPSVLAYAELAGLAPVHGLYAALAGMIAYALFASSRHVIAGPDAAVTLLVGTGISGLIGGDPARAAVLAAMVALLCGILMLVASRLGIGMVADFLSKPVLVGYMTGAALILMSTQFGKLFGVKIEGHDFFGVLWHLIRQLGETKPLTLGLGLGFLAMLAALRRFAPKIPGALAVFIVGLAISAAFGLKDRGVSVIGDVPRGLPRLSLPMLPLATVRELLPAAIGISLLIFPEGILLARAFAAKNRYEVKPNQELIALAASNLAAGLFQGFPVGASQSRTTVNDATGGKSQVSSLVAASALLLFLLFLTPLLAPLPQVALAAILIYSGIHLIEVEEFRRLLRVSRQSFALAVLVMWGVLIVGVVPGILIGVMLSLIVLLGRLARPADAVLRETPGGTFHDMGDVPEAESVPGLIAYRFYAPLFFANADHFVERIRSLIAASPEPVRWVLVDLQAVTDIDVTAAEAMLRLREEFEAQGIALKIARANRPLRAKLARYGLGDQLGENNLFPSVSAGVAVFRQISQTS